MAGKRTPQNKQPRGVSPDLATQGTYRAGLYAEQQKFGNTKARQLLLFEAGRGADAPERPEVYGLDLTVSEDKALSALQILLHRTDYKGNVPGLEARSQDYKWEGLLPRLRMTYTEFFEAYGLKKRGDQYEGAQREEALKALDSLSKPRRIVYRRRKWKGEGRARKELSDVIVTNRPLINVDKGYKDLEEPEASRVVQGEDLPAERVTNLLVDFSPLLVDGIHDFYLMKPAGLHREIEALYPSKRVPRAVSLFIEWLLTLDQKTLKASKDVLIDRLRLDNYIKRRRRKEAEERLQEAFSAAKELGFLLDYQEDGLGSVAFEINPQRCRRVGARLSRG